jgi:hypothetical protein
MPGARAAPACIDGPAWCTRLLHHAENSDHRDCAAAEARDPAAIGATTTTETARPMVPRGLGGERQLLRTGLRRRQPLSPRRVGARPAGARAAVIASAEGPQTARIPACQAGWPRCRVMQVEERLGVRLLNRSSRRFSVTEIGREFYDRCVAMLVEAEAAEQVIAQVRAEPRGVVRMSCPVALLNSQFGALIAMACRHDGRAQRRHRSGGARLVLGFPAGPARLGVGKRTQLSRRLSLACGRARNRAAYPTANVAMAEASRSPP